MRLQKDNRLQEKLQKFWRSGDEIVCTRIFRRSDNECYLCGKTPIEWHHVLLNTISNETIDVERNCVIEIKKILEGLGSAQKILFFKKYAVEMDQLNHLHDGTAEILEFNTNAEIMIQLFSKPGELTYKQIRAVMDHTMKFREGIEVELFEMAMDLYADRKYYIYEGLREDEKTENVEVCIKMAIQREWEEFQSEEEEQARQVYESMSSYPSED